MMFTISNHQFSVTMTTVANVIEDEKPHTLGKPLHSNLRQTQRRSPSSSTKSSRSGGVRPSQRWIPKHILQAQGYYKGATQVWLPKRQINRSSKEVMQTGQLPPPALKPFYHTRPTEVQTKPTHIWKPKTTQCQSQTSSSTAKSSAGHSSDQPQPMPTCQVRMSIKERATLLQNLIRNKVPQTTSAWIIEHALTPSISTSFHSVGITCHH